MRRISFRAISDTSTTMKIVTEYWAKPIPRRDWDWAAYDDDTYDGPGCPVGTGATEAEAIADLMEKLE